MIRCQWNKLNLKKQKFDCMSFMLTHPDFRDKKTADYIQQEQD